MEFTTLAEKHHALPTIPKSMSNGFGNVKSAYVAFIVRKYSEHVALQELLHCNNFVPKHPNECFQYLMRRFGTSDAPLRLSSSFNHYLSQYSFTSTTQRNAHNKNYMISMPLPQKNKSLKKLHELIIV